MDNLHLQKEVQALEKLHKHYKDELRLVGFELCELPDDVAALLDECVELQRATNLHALKANYLKEFYFLKQRECIDNRDIMAKLQAEIRQQEREIEKEIAECASLEKFTTGVNKRLVSEAELQRHQAMLQAKMQALQNRQNALTIPEDLNIDELIRKVDLLKQTKKSKTK